MGAPFLSGGGTVDTLARLGLVLNTFDDLMDHGRALVASPVAIIDEFEDSAGIDAANSTGETYDAGGFVSNPETIGADAVPTMTAASAPSGTASASSEDTAGEAAFKAFDDDNATNWQSSALPSWLQYEFAAGEVINHYSLKMSASGATSGRWPEDFILYGSATGAFAGEEVALDTRSGVTWTAGEEKTFSFANSTAFLVYRLAVSKNFSESKTNISNMALQPDAAAPALDVRSVGVTMGAAPSAGFFVGKFSESDPDAVYCSSDGGATWDEVTLSDYGDYGSGVSVLGGPVSLTGGGTDVRLRAAKAAGAECRVNAWGGVFGS